MIARRRVYIALAGIVVALISPMVSGAADPVIDQKVQNWRDNLSVGIPAGFQRLRCASTIQARPDRHSRADPASFSVFRAE
jgi:hypothetical protein